MLKKCWKNVEKMLKKNISGKAVFFKQKILKNVKKPIKNNLENISCYFRNFLTLFNFF